MPKICRKCKEKFPYKVKIDGKERNLGSRKFCLNCSPFGSRNTKPDDPAKQSCRKQIDGKRVKFSDWSDDAKERNRAMQYYYRHKRIKECVELKGGCCEECGYNNCIRALDFHHTNPEEKSFELNSRTIMVHSWDEIIKEVNKCKLLCSNCHRELHEKEQVSKYATVIKEMYNYDV